MLEQNKILDCITYHLTNDTPDLKKERQAGKLLKEKVCRRHSGQHFPVFMHLIILIISAVTALFNSVSKELLKKC